MNEKVMIDLKNSPKCNKWLKIAKRREKYSLYYDLVFWMKLKYVIYLRKYFK